MKVRAAISRRSFILADPVRLINLRALLFEELLVEFMKPPRSDRLWRLPTGMLRKIIESRVDFGD